MGENLPCEIFLNRVEVGGLVPKVSQKENVENGRDSLESSGSKKSP